MANKACKLAVSTLACNSAFLGDGIQALERFGADCVHMDVTDGHYVHNLTYGPAAVRDLKAAVSLPIEVHLELLHSDWMLHGFAESGASRIVLQRDCCKHPIRELRQIRSLGVQAGIAINPADSIDGIELLFPYLDSVILMSVEPGFGGQPFEESCLKKLEKMRDMLDKDHLDIELCVDGGISLDNIERIKRRGADMVVVGSGLHRGSSLQDTVAKMKR